MNRTDKENYYLDIAETVAERGTCLRHHFGAIIVNNDEIISTGYYGAPRGRKNCTDLGFCTWKKHGEKDDNKIEICRSVHAETNAIISAKRNEMFGGTMYLVGKAVSSGEYIENTTSCLMCKRMIINAGIETVIIRDTENSFRTIEVCDWVYYDESLDHRNGH
jgi:dCMP deaminase